MFELRNYANPSGLRDPKGSLLLVIFLPLSHYKKGTIVRRKYKIIWRNCNVYHWLSLLSEHKLAVILMQWLIYKTIVVPLQSPEVIWRCSLEIKGPALVDSLVVPVSCIYDSCSVMVWLNFYFLQLYHFVIYYFPISMELFYSYILQVISLIQFIVISDLVI